ncbi:MAG: putative lipopolysaccharide heptosyltransferase III [Desulfatiglandales bacterium]
MRPYGNYPDLDRIRRILVIKLRHHGDVLLTSPVFTNLRRRLPEARIEAMIYKETLPMLEGHPAVDRFHLYDPDWKKLPGWRRLAREVSFIRQVRQEGFDLAINLTEGDRGAFAAWLSKAPCRVGFESKGKKSWGKERIYTHRVKRPDLPRHMVEQNLDALRRIGIFPGPEERALSLHIPDADQRRITERLSRAGIRPHTYVLVHPTSRWLFKCWPMEKTILLVRRLIEEGMPVVLSSAPDPKELELIEMITAGCGNRSLLNLGGKLTLKELCALIGLSRCLVTIDSVPMHIASALKTPVVAVFGPSSDVVWGPWHHASGRVVAPDVPCRPCNLDGCGGGKVCDCLERVSVDRVAESLRELLAFAPPGEGAMPRPQAL